MEAVNSDEEAEEQAEDEVEGVRAVNKSPVRRSKEQGKEK